MTGAETAEGDRRRGERKVDESRGCGKVKVVLSRWSRLGKAELPKEDLGSREESPVKGRSSKQLVTRPDFEFRS